MKVLLLAEAANPEWVSVPLVGWSLANAIRDRVDAHLVTHVRNGDAIRRAGLVEDRDFTTIDSERLARPAWKLASLLRGGEGKGWTTLSAINALTYPYFEHLVWRRFGAAIRRGDFDLVHRITPLSPTTISPMAKKCRKAGIPFIAGPLNGGVPWPKGYHQERIQEREWLSYLRGLYRFLPGHRKSLLATTSIIAGSRHTAGEIPHQLRDRTFYMPENGIDRSRFSLTAKQPATLPVRFCFLGRLVPYKGPDLAIQALEPFLAEGSATLDIIGDGPMMATLRSMSENLLIPSAVRFHGWLEHRKVQEAASACHCLIFPSVREFGGGAVVEAMALGLVPIVVDYAGPGELVDPSIGFKVPVGPKEEIVGALRRVVGHIVSDPSILSSLASRAQDFVFRNFDWNQKAERLVAFYAQLLTATREDGPLPELQCLEPFRGE